MVWRFEIEVVIILTTKEILDIKVLLIIVFINSKLLYDYLIKLISI